MLHRTAVATTLLLLGCGEPLPDTQGEAFDQLMEAFCITLIDCVGDGDVSVSECVDAGHESFCGQEGIDCSEEIDTDDVTRGEWNDCLDALETLPCSAVDDGFDLPRECRDIDF